MSQSLSKRWFHKFTDFLMPGNCRKSLENAFSQNQIASMNFVLYLNRNEHRVIKALKEDRRTVKQRGMSDAGT